jgi:hypothetical protein
MRAACPQEHQRCTLPQVDTATITGAAALTMSWVSLCMMIGCHAGSTQCDGALVEGTSRFRALQSVVSAEATEGNGYSAQQREELVALATEMGLAANSLSALRGEDVESQHLGLARAALARVEGTRLHGRREVVEAGEALNRCSASCLE